LPIGVILLGFVQISRIGAPILNDDYSYSGRMQRFESTSTLACSLLAEIGAVWDYLAPTEANQK
jgi:hypothetical protein